MLQEGIDEYIASLSTKEQGREEPNPNTIVAYRNDLNQACTYFTRQGIESWQHVTLAHIAIYMLEMQEDQAYRLTTIARKMASLKSFFHYLRAHGSISVHIIEDLNAPR